MPASFVQLDSNATKEWLADAGGNGTCTAKILEYACVSKESLPVLREMLLELESDPETQPLVELASQLREKTRRNFCFVPENMAKDTPIFANSSYIVLEAISSSAEPMHAKMQTKAMFASALLSFVKTAPLEIPPQHIYWRPQLSIAYGLLATGMLQEGENFINTLEKLTETIPQQIFISLLRSHHAYKNNDPVGEQSHLDRVTNQYAHLLSPEDLTSIYKKHQKYTLLPAVTTETLKLAWDTNDGSPYTRQLLPLVRVSDASFAPLVAQALLSLEQHPMVKQFIMLAAAMNISFCFIQKNMLTAFDQLDKSVTLGIVPDHTNPNALPLEPAFIKTACLQALLDTAILSDVLGPKLTRQYFSIINLLRGAISKELAQDFEEALKPGNDGALAKFEKAVPVTLKIHKLSSSFPDESRFAQQVLCLCIELLSLPEESRRKLPDIRMLKSLEMFYSENIAPTVTLAATLPKKRQPRRKWTNQPAPASPLREPSPLQEEQPPTPALPPRAPSPLQEQPPAPASPFRVPSPEPASPFRAPSPELAMLQMPISAQSVLPPVPQKHEDAPRSRSALSSESAPAAAGEAPILAVPLPVDQLSPLQSASKAEISLTISLAMPPELPAIPTQDALPAPLPSPAIEAGMVPDLASAHQAVEKMPEYILYPALATSPLLSQAEQLPLPELSPLLPQKEQNPGATQSYTVQLAPQPALSLSLEMPPELPAIPICQDAPKLSSLASSAPQAEAVPNFAPLPLSPQEQQTPIQTRKRKTPESESQPPAVEIPEADLPPLQKVQKVQTLQETLLIDLQLVPHPSPDPVMEPLLLSPPRAASPELFTPPSPSPQEQIAQEWEGWKARFKEEISEETKKAFYTFISSRFDSASPQEDAIIWLPLYCCIDAFHHLAIGEEEGAGMLFATSWQHLREAQGKHLRDFLSPVKGDGTLDSRYDTYWKVGVNIAYAFLNASLDDAAKQIAALGSHATLPHEKIAVFLLSAAYYAKTGNGAEAVKSAGYARTVYQEEITNGSAKEPLHEAYKLYWEYSLPLPSPAGIDNYSRQILSSARIGTLSLTTPVLKAFEEMEMPGADTLLSLRFFAHLSRKDQEALRVNFITRNELPLYSPFDEQGKTTIFAGNNLFLSVIPGNEKMYMRQKLDIQLAFAVLSIRMMMDKAYPDGLADIGTESGRGYLNALRKTYEKGQQNLPDAMHIQNTGNSLEDFRHLQERLKTIPEEGFKELGNQHEQQHPMFITLAKALRSSPDITSFLKQAPSIYMRFSVLVHEYDLRPQHLKRNPQAMPDQDIMQPLATFFRQTLFPELERKLGIEAPQPSPATASPQPLPQQQPRTAAPNIMNRASNSSGWQERENISRGARYLLQLAAPQSSRAQTGSFRGS